MPLLGTDSLGRDILARVLVATRLSILLAVFATLGGAAVGMVFGALSSVLGRIGPCGQRHDRRLAGLPPVAGHVPGDWFGRRGHRRGHRVRRRIDAKNSSGLPKPRPRRSRVPAIWLGPVILNGEREVLAVYALASQSQAVECLG